MTDAAFFTKLKGVIKVKLSKMKRVISGTVSALMIASSVPVVAAAADQQTRGNVGGYDYEMWNQNGQGQASMNPGAGSFTCSWSNIENFLARMGKNYDSQGKNYKEIGNIVLTYDVEYTPRGNSYMCVYGWTKSPLVEYYIVEGWGDWRPPGNDGENKGTVTLNGNTYDIRKSMRYNQPSLEGTSTFPQYWSVRQTSGSANNQTNYMKGTIDVSKHFDAWSQAGLDMSGKLYEVSLNIEGYRSNGSANVKSVTVSTDGSGAGAAAPANNNAQQQNNDWNNQWNNQQQNNDWNNQWNNQQQNNDWNNQWNNQQQNNDWNNQWNNQQQNNDWNNQWNNQQQNNDWNNQWNNQQQNNDWNNQWNNQQQNNNWNNQWNNQQQNNNWNNDWQNNVTQWGDANGDNNVDMGDTVYIMQSLANPNKYSLTEQGMYNGDVYNPGSGITNYDAQSLQMFFLGMIPNLPYGNDWNNWNNQNQQQNNWNQNNDWNNQNQQNNWNQNNDWNNQNQQQNWNQNNDWNNQNQQQNWNQNNDWNNQNQQQNNWNQNNDWNNQNQQQNNWNQNNDWNNQNQQQNWNQNNDWNNQNQQQNWNQNNDWNNQNQQQNWNQNNDWNNQNQQQNNWNQNNDWNNQNQQQNWNQNNDWNNQWNNQQPQNNAVPAGTEMNKNATMSDDFRNGSSRHFIASDGWENGDPFDCGWYASQTAFRNGALELTIDRDNTGKYNYAGAEYRTNDFYGFGYYETSMQAIKNNGVVSSFFTYTGESDGNPWDEIDIEILGKDTTKVQFNYYTNGQGKHEFMYDLGFDASQGFHTYGFDWQRDHITWYVDGKAVYTANQNIPQTPGKIMMNAWPGRGVDEWLAHYDGRTPLTARYQWVTYNKQ